MQTWPIRTPSSIPGLIPNFRIADDPPGIAVLTAGQELPRFPFYKRGCQ